MSEKERNDYRKKIIEGLELAQRRMLEDKAMRGETLVYSSDDGEIYTITAKEALVEYNSKRNS